MLNPRSTHTLRLAGTGFTLFTVLTTLSALWSAACTSVPQRDAGAGADGMGSMDRAIPTDRGTVTVDGDSQVSCAEGLTACNGECVDTNSSPAHCGRCGEACTSVGGAGVCVAGRCTIVCSARRANCDQNPNNGCEVDTNTSVQNCGACNTPCVDGPNATATCAAGRCFPNCREGYGDCDQNPMNGCEASLQGSENCGSCRNACRAPQGNCANGMCTNGCAPLVQCGAGSCVNTATDVNNCGACGVRCPAGTNQTPTCAAGQCGTTCNANFGDCDGAPATGCETNLLTSMTSCGRCANRCADGMQCNMGMCAGCPAGSTLCNGACVNLTADVNNCGSCGRMCPALNMGIVGPISCRPPGPNGGGGGNNRVGFCRAGDDFCAQSRGDCNGIAGDGYETDLRTTRDHCGMCGRRCTLPNTACCNGACQDPNAACPAC